MCAARTSAQHHRAVMCISEKTSFQSPPGKYTHCSTWICTYHLVATPCPTFTSSLVCISGEKSPQGKGPFYRLGSMKTRSVELPRRQRSASLTSITPQSSTGTQGLTAPQPPSQPQSQFPAGLSPAMGQTGTLAASNSGLLTTSSGALAAAGPSGGIGSGVRPRPPQPSTPPQQLPAADGYAQEQVS